MATGKEARRFRSFRVGQLDRWSAASVVVMNSLLLANNIQQGYRYQSLLSVFFLTAGAAQLLFLKLYKKQYTRFRLYIALFNRSSRLLLFTASILTLRTSAPLRAAHTHTATLPPPSPHIPLWAYGLRAVAGTSFSTLPLLHSLSALLPPPCQLTLHSIYSLALVRWHLTTAHHILTHPTLHPQLTALATTLNHALSLIQTTFFGLPPTPPPTPPPPEDTAWVCLTFAVLYFAWFLPVYIAYRAEQYIRSMYIFHATCRKLLAQHLQPPGAPPSASPHPPTPTLTPPHPQHSPPPSGPASQRHTPQPLERLSSSTPLRVRATSNTAASPEAGLLTPAYCCTPTSPTASTITPVPTAPPNPTQTAPPPPPPPAPAPATTCAPSSTHEASAAHFSASEWPGSPPVQVTLAPTAPPRDRQPTPRSPPPHATPSLDPTASPTAAAYTQHAQHSTAGCSPRVTPGPPRPSSDFAESAPHAHQPFRLTSEAPPPTSPGPLRFRQRLPTYHPAPTPTTTPGPAASTSSTTAAALRNEASTSLGAVASTEGQQATSATGTEAQQATSATELAVLDREYERLVRASPLWPLRHWLLALCRAGAADPQEAGQVLQREVANVDVHWRWVHWQGVPAVVPPVPFPHPLDLPVVAAFGLLAWAVSLHLHPWVRLAAV